MENELKARITADISGFKAAIVQVEKGMEDVEQASKRTSVQVDKVGNATKNLGKNFGGASKDIKGANTVALEFNRIIQDAPFGIIGVGNNIQQLTANFSNLSKNAGGAVPAIKAAFSALLTGPNIALLAISALTTAFTLFQMGLFKSKDEAISLREELEKYRDTLGTLNRAQIEGAANAAKEAQSLALLRAQAENLSISEEVRLEAVKELQKQYPEYLGNLTQEQILTGNVGGAYDKLNKSILETAKARAFSAQIEDNYRDILTLQNKETEIQIQLEEKRSKLEAARAAASSAQGATQTSLLFQQNRIQDQINNLLEDEIANRAEIDKLNAVNAQLSAEITKNIEEGAKFTKATETATGNAAKNAKELKYNFSDILEIDFNDLNKRIGKAVGGVDTGGIQDIKVKVSLPVEEIAEDITSINSEIELLEAGFQDVIEKNSLGILTQTAGAFGNEIAASFETGNAVLDSFVRNLFRAVPQIIAAYTKLSAARNAQANASLGANAKESAGEGITLATKAANALGPVGLAVLPVLIAGALGLIASAFTKAKSGGGASAGGGSSQSFGNTGKREFGGPVTKGQAYIVGEKRPELFVPNTNGVIIPQLPKVGGTSTGGGGTMKIEVEVKGRIDGESIRLSNKRSNTRVRNT